jgi:hypothetical protein
MLTANEFKQQVRLEARLKDAKISLAVVDTIADLFVNRNQPTHDHIGLAVAMAHHEIAQIRAMQKRETRATMAELVLSLRTPEAVLSCRQREETVRPAVEQLRRDYFGSEKVPFQSYEKAVDWLRQKAVIGRSKPNPKQMYRLVDDVIKAMQRFPKNYDLEFSMGSHAISLLAPKPGALKSWVGFDKGTALEHLKKVTESMANGTGCDVALCVAHVLSGAPLILHPLDWGIEFSSGCGINRRSATINILQPHAITLPVLIQGFRLIRRELGLTKKKTMTEQHERLLRLVEKRGGVPTQGKTEFWEDVRRTLNKAVPKGEHPYETWRGPLMAYRRIQSALKKR